MYEEQGDPTSLPKDRPNEAQPIFCQN
jgi:hypothetical protein